MKAKGFTMVELLVTLVVIGILAGLLTTAIQNARERGRVTQCANNLKQLHTAVINYAGEGGQFPAATTYEYMRNNEWHIRRGWVDWESDTGTKFVRYFQGGSYNMKGRTSITNGTLYRYIMDERVYICPSFLRNATALIKSKNRTEIPVRSYVMNWRYDIANLFGITDGSKKMLFCEVNVTYNVDGTRVVGYGALDPNNGIPAQANWPDNTYHPTTAYRMPYYLSCDGALTPTIWSAGKPFEGIGGNHGSGKGNVVFADGHVELLLPADTVNVCAGNW